MRYKSNVVDFPAFGAYSETDKFNDVPFFHVTRNREEVHDMHKRTHYGGRMAHNHLIYTTTPATARPTFNFIATTTGAGRPPITG